MTNKTDYEQLTKVTQQDLDEGVWDAEHKGLYSKDGKRFLQYIRPKSLEWGVPDTFQLKSGVEVICEKAFEQYHSPLTSFVIPDSVVAIGTEAFQQMRLPQHASIIIPKGLIYIGHVIFGSYHGILNIVFEEGITKIDLANILDFPAALTVYLPSTLENIGDEGFGGCEVSHIHVAEGNKHFCVVDGILYDYAKTTLLRCPVTKRGELRIPEGVTTIASYAFQLSGYQDAIDAESEPKLSVILPNSLTKIEKSAFRASWIESLYIPSNVSKIEDSAFEWPVSLAIQVAPNNDYYEVRNNLLIDKREKKVLYGFGDCIEIPNDIKTIANNALGHLELKSLVIPEGVTRIGVWNFNLNTLLHIKLPYRLQDITRSSFWGSSREPQDVKIEVPSGMGEIYKEKIYDFYGDYDITSFIKEKEVCEMETNNVTSLVYADELRQIYDNYCQGFLSQEEYDFQTGLYKKWGDDGIASNGLHVVENGTFGDEDLYNISKNVSQFISGRFIVNNEFDPDFCWLKYFATRPCFHHLCFTYKKTVYSCLIGVVMENGEVWISSQDAENLFRECMSNCLYPCIIPVTQSGEIYDEQTPVLDAKTLQPIDFDVQEEFVPPIMTKYELRTRAINEIALYLMDRGCSNIATCDIMSISPSIFFNDEDGKHSYIVIRSLPAGCDSRIYSFNKGVIDYHKNDKGYFVNLLWNNLDGNNGNFMDTKIIKNGSYVHKKIELEPLDPIEVFEINHPRFTFVNEKLYSVVDKDIEAN